MLTLTPTLNLAQVRKAAVVALRQLDVVAHAPAIVRMLEDADEDVRAAALETLGTARAAALSARVPVLITALISRLEDSSASVRAATMTMLRALGAAALAQHAAAFAARLAHTDWRVRQAAAQMLGELEAAVLTEHVGALVAMLRDVYADVREAALQALGRLDEAALEPHAATLGALLDDPERSVRRVASRSLGRHAVLSSVERCLGALSLRPAGGLSARAFAGSRSILLAMDVADSSALARCAGFAVRRETLSSGALVWLSPSFGRRANVDAAPAAAAADEVELPPADPPIDAQAYPSARRAVEGRPFDTNTESLCEIWLGDSDDGSATLAGEGRSAASPSATSDEYDPCVRPIRSFRVADHTVLPGAAYEYRVFQVVVGADDLSNEVRRARRLLNPPARIRVAAEDEFGHPDGVEVHLNCGVAGSQTFARRFGKGFAERDRWEPAQWAWLSRGLEEGLLRFIERASGGAGWGLRGAFYEFSYAPLMAALARCRDAGADVRFVYDGKLPSWHTARREWLDHGPSLANEGYIRASGLLDNAVRRAQSVSAIQHNKFLVLLKDGEPRAVWSGSVNLTAGALFGHLNVGFVHSDPGVARAFLDYWTALSRDPPAREFKAFNSEHNPVPALSEHGSFALFSPRSSDDSLSYFGALIRGAREMVAISAAFGLSAAITEALLHAPVGSLARVRGGTGGGTGGGTSGELLGGAPHDVATYVLLDNEGRGASARFVEAVRTLPYGHVTCGAHLEQAEVLCAHQVAERLTGFNEHVQYVAAPLRPLPLGHS